MGYQFDFDWGESWVVVENDFEWDREYWFKVLARHINFFREKVRDVKPLDLITSVIIFHNDKYNGIVSVSDNNVHVIMGGDDGLRNFFHWRVDEL